MDSFVFRMPDAESSLFSIFASMREANELCNITIRAGDVNIRAHRVVLAAGIPYFRTLLQSNFVETAKEEIQIKYIDAEVLRDLINFLYTNSLTITNENVVSLLKESNYLLMDHVTNACLNFMWERLNPENVITVWIFAEITLNKEIKDDTSRFIRENFDEVAMSKGFLELFNTEVQEIISWDDLNALNEETVFEAVIRWVNEFWKERFSFLPELLRHVRMLLLTTDYPEKFVFSEEPFRIFLLRDMINKARKFHSQSSVVFNISSLKRFCREKHHLRCAKQMGFVVYSVCCISDLTYSVSYYDQMNRRLYSLCNLNAIPSLFGLNIFLNCFMACNEEYIYFIACSFIVSLNLRTMEPCGLQIETSLLRGAAIILQRNHIFIFGGMLSLNPLKLKDDILQLKLKDDILQLKLKDDILQLKLKDDILQFKLKDDILQLKLKDDILQLKLKDDILQSKLKDDILQLKMPEAQYKLIGKMKDRRADSACALLDDSIYITGGSISNSAEVFDIKTRISREISPMLTRRFLHRCTSFDGKIYACGGMTSGAFGELLHSGSCECYNPATGQWTYIADMRSVRIPRSLRSFEGKLYVSGLTDEITDCFEVYDPGSNEWTVEYSSLYSSRNWGASVLLSNSFSIL